MSSLTRTIFDPDVTPPNAPSALAATTGTNTVSLTWSPATEATSPAGQATSGFAFHNVYRDAAVIGTTTGASFVDNTVNTSTSHTYRVTGVDAAGNESAFSSTITTQGSASSTANRFALLSFEGLSIVGRNLSAVGGWKDIVGTDTVSGLSYPRAPAAGGPVALWGGNAGAIDSIQNIGDGISTPNDIDASIVTITGPLGTPRKALRFRFNTAYNANVGGISGNTMQNSHMFFPDTSVAQTMLYQRKWVIFDPTMDSRGGFGFFEIAETKTSSTERHFLTVVKQSFTGNFMRWTVGHDDFAGTGGAHRDLYQVFLSHDTSLVPFQTGQTYVAPIPLGVLIKVEMAQKFVFGQEGWFWMALTIPSSADPVLRAGTQVYFGTGALSYSGANGAFNVGWNPQINQRMNRIFSMMAYSNISRSPASPLDYTMTDVELYRAWPDDATAHPNVT